VTIEPTPGVAAPVPDGNDGIDGSSSDCSTGTCDGQVLSVPSGQDLTLTRITTIDADNTTTNGGDGGAMFVEGPGSPESSSEPATTPTASSAPATTAPATRAARDQTG
jgi:hypothetical protein